MYWFKHVKKGIDPEVSKRTLIEYIIIKLIGTASMIIGLYHFMGLRVSWISKGTGADEIRKITADLNGIGVSLIVVGVACWLFGTSYLERRFYLDFDEENADDKKKEKTVIKTQLILFSYYLLITILYGLAISFIEGEY